MVFRLGVGFDSLDEIDELPDFIARGVLRRLLGQINKSHENGIAGCALHAGA